MSRRAIPVLTSAALALLASCTARNVDPATTRSLEAGAGDHEAYQEAYEEWFSARAYPSGEPGNSQPRRGINWEVYEAGRQTRGLMDISGQGDRWQYLGPTNCGVASRYGQGLPPVNGRVNAIAFDALNPDRIYYAATACGGLWKTTNAGQTWVPRSDGWEELYTSSIAIGSDGVIYVGTGDYPGSRGSGVGLMISDDGGDTWSGYDFSPLSGKSLSDVVVDPENPMLVTVATAPRSVSGTKVYQSDDGGQSFGTSINQNATWCDLAIGAPALGPGGIMRYYYATGRSTTASGNEFWRSPDRGASWERKALPFGNLNHITIKPLQNKQLGVTTSPRDWRTVYIVGTTSREVWKSTDAGDSWTEITGNLPLDSLWWGQDFYSFRIHCFTRQRTNGPEDALLLATTDVHLGDSHGNWKSIGGPTYSNNALVHVDTMGFATHPADPNLHLVLNDGGVYRYDYNPDSNDGVFTSLNRTLGCMLPNRLSVHPTNEFFLMGGTQDNGTCLTIGDIQNWFGIVAGDTGHTAINQQFPQFQYACEPFLGKNNANDVFIIRTDDSWNQGSGSELTTNIGTDKIRHGTPIIIDPNDTNFLYFGSNYLYRYDEITHQWDDRIGNRKLSEDGFVQTLDIAPSDSEWIYTGSNKGELWMTTDRGQTWRRIDDGANGPSSLPESTIAAISVDPTDRKRVLVACAGTYNLQLWECKDTTADPVVWDTPVGAGTGKLPAVPTNAIARHPSSPSKHWFVATDIGVFGTDNSGGAWYNMTNPLGLPNVEVTDLRAMPITKYLYASTFGRGFWRIKLKTLPGVQILGQ